MKNGRRSPIVCQSAINVIPVVVAVDAINSNRSNDCGSRICDVGSRRRRSGTCCIVDKAGTRQGASRVSRLYPCYMHISLYGRRFPTKERYNPMAKN
jgi:hypothetical protein